MSENVIHICGLSMEMEMAKEMGWIGKCRGCLYCDWIKSFGVVKCRKLGGLIKEQEDCKEWVVDHR